MRPVPLLAAVALATSPLAAQQPTPAPRPAPTAPAGNPNLERIANDRYTRSHDYDLVHQRIALRDFDWDSTSFKGSVATTLVALRPALDSVVLDAGALLGVRTVKDARGTPLRTARHGDTLVVFLARPAAFRETVRFTIDYDGKVENGRGLTYIEQRPHTPRQIWSQGEDMDNHFWFPTYDFPNDKMTWELEATVPAGYVAVSNGRLARDTRGAGGTRTMTWTQERPSATYLVSLIVAPLAKVHDSWRGVPVDYYVYHADSALAWRLFHVTPDMIAVYSRLTGVDYPWAKYAQTTVADFFGGMENVSATTLVDWLPDARAYQDRPWYQYILIPHELAHQWFGDYVTTENWANSWLNEGFAEFMPGQYWATKRGAHAEQDYYVDEYRSFMDIDARRRMPLAALESNNIYPKGALVLEMLKHHLGEQRFWAGINRYLARHALDNATTDDLRQAFLDATGENLDWFWNEWIYSAGYPEFTVSAAYDSTARRLRLVVRQTQRDTLPADSAGMRYVVPEVFRMPLDVRVGTVSGDVVRRVTIDQREDTVVVDSLTGAPTMVVFDDGNHVLKKLTFDQPTAWLAQQLRSDADLWDRQWAIAQLAKRPADSAAARALAEAATGADYYLTRVHAATALGAVPGEVSSAALARVAHDTSSQVRQAAMTALGQLGGARSIELARAAWQSDSSYAVRAAALDALIRLDSASRRALITQGLSTPSYRDAIQTAALRAIVRTADTTMLAQVQQLVGDQQLPVFALGAMASRGSRHALDLLVSDLNDQRAWVRRWAVSALTRGMDSKVALPALQAAQATLKYPETRRAVTRELERMVKESAKPAS